MLMTARPASRASALVAVYAALIAIVLTAYLREPDSTIVATSSPVVSQPVAVPAGPPPPAAIAVTGTLPPAPPPPAPVRPTATAPPSTASATRQAVTTATVRPKTTIPGSGYLDCVRRRESRAQYGVVNPGSSAGGAYQFLPATWDATARRAGRYDLVGVHPSRAARRDQDAMAAYLLSWQGRQHWAGPGC